MKLESDLCFKPPEQWVETILAAFEDVRGAERERNIECAKRAVEDWCKSQGEVQVSPSISK